MANPTDDGPFRAELDDGQIIEADGSTIRDPASGAEVPAVVLRMSPARAHVLAHVLDDWSRAALIFATLRSSEVTERALAWTLEAGAAATGDPEAGRCALRVAANPDSDPAAGRRRRPAAARTAGSPRFSGSPWSTPRPGGSPKTPARNSPKRCCKRCAPRPTTASFAYLALIDRPGLSQ